MEDSFLSLHFCVLTNWYISPEEAAAILSGQKTFLKELAEENNQ